MHILIIPSWYPSRHRPLNGIFFKEQAEILSKHTDKIGVVAPLFRTFRNLDVSRNQMSGQVVNNVIAFTKEIWHFPKLERLNKKRWITTCLELFENYIIKNGKPDVVHIHSIILAGYVAQIIKNKYQIPFVVTEHASGFALNLYEKEYPEFQEIIKASSKNIAVSKFLAEVLYKRIQGDWQVIPNTIKDEFFINGRQSLQNKKNKNHFQFFTLSNLITIKGLNFLIPAFKEMVSEYKNVELKLVIGGDGEERQKLENLVREHQLIDNVHFLGSINRQEVLKQYSEADFYISSSLQETFGVVIVEALAFGLPVVATRCGGPEYIVNNEVGIIVEKESTQELVRGMKFMLENRNFYNRENIIKYTEETYSERIVGKQIVDVYRKVING